MKRKPTVRILQAMDLGNCSQDDQGKKRKSQERNWVFIDNSTA